MLRLYRSIAGAVSLMVTLVPAVTVGALCPCTQYVLPDDARYWCVIFWLAPIVREVARSQSLPTPKTHELCRVVTSAAAGAPGFAFPLPVAPTAPEPFVPDASTPLKLMTVIDAAMLCDVVALT